MPDVSTQFKCSECKWFSNLQPLTPNRCHEGPPVPFTTIGSTGGLVVNWEYPRVQPSDWCGKWVKGK